MAKIKENLSVIKLPGDKSKIYCHEDYAQELYNIMNKVTFHSSVKDLKEGQILKVKDFKILKSKEIEVTCSNFETLYFEPSKEKRFFEMLGMNEESFLNWLKSGLYLHYLQENKVYISVENVPLRKGSLYSAHIYSVAIEFKEQISNPTSAYTAKILQKNGGGFLVEVQGIKAFMPGSLAAANKISDFDSYIGKEIPVMIEDYLKPSDIFVVSYKKYLDQILPGELSRLKRNSFMTGTITGASKFGVFVEFNEIFTGLLHTTEMDPSTLDKFTQGKFKPGTEMSAWLKDIKDNKLILTEIDPNIKSNEIEEYRERVEGITKLATIISIKPHGALMEIEKGMLGLLPVKEMKKSGRRLNVGEELLVCIKKVDVSSGKMYLTLSDSKVEA
jgi:predicted RNA-binding protein with RPS1 domain